VIPQYGISKPSIDQIVKNNLKHGQPAQTTLQSLYKWHIKNPEGFDPPTLQGLLSEISGKMLKLTKKK
jgi:hypothetical protein